MVSLVQQVQQNNKGIIKKKYKYLGKTLERQIPKNNSSLEVFGFIMEELVSLNKREYKNYFFDLKTFKVIGGFINFGLI